MGTLVRDNSSSVKTDPERAEGEGEGCSNFKDCIECSNRWPKCAWCSSSGTCLHTTGELLEKAPRLFSTHQNSQVNNIHVLYNVEEYSKSYGRRQRLHPLESVEGTECLVWILNGSSCTWVDEYCHQPHASSCRMCVRGTHGGCGWCAGAKKCLPGTLSGALKISADDVTCDATGEQGFQWVFGGWATYMDYGVWQDSCPLRPSLDDSASSSQHRYGQPQDPGGNGVVSQMVPIALAVMFSVMVLSVFFLIKFRRVAVFDGGAPRAPPDIQPPSGREIAYREGVDIEALEFQNPNCRPVVIGASPEHRRNHEIVTDIDSDLCSETSRQSTVPCAVCLCHLAEGEEARRLPCNHLFHKQCIDSWLSKSLQCPVCRQAVGRPVYREVH